MWQDIIDFHQKFGLARSGQISKLDEEEYYFRLRFLEEELKEFIDADDIEDQIDALVDLVVIAMGTAYRMGVNWPDHWNEVHRANMAKVRASDASDSKRGSKLDIVKPKDWVGPNHTQFL